MVNNLLLMISHKPALLAGIALGGLLLLALAVIAGFRRRRLAVPPGALGLLLCGVALAALVKNPSALRPESENLERLAGVELSAAPPDADDWPQWRGPNRDGLARAPGLRLDWEKKPPEVLWTAPLGSGYSSFAVVGDAAVTQDYRDGRERVVCLNVKDGKERWSYEYPADYSGTDRSYAMGPRATPAIHDGRVYAVGATGQFLCLPLDPAGAPKPHWQHDLLAEFDAPLPRWGVAGSPLVEGELVIVQPGGGKGTVVAFDRKTGAPAWAALTEESGYSSPVAATLAGVRQVVAFTGARLVGLAANDGKELWAYDFPTQYNGNIATPLVIGDTVFITAGYGSGCALVKVVAEGGALRAEPVFRKKGLLRAHHMTPVLRDGHVYGSHDFRGDLTCVDLRNPKVPVWDTPRAGKGSLLLAEGHLVLLTERGTLALIEATPAGYRPKGKLDVLSGGDCWAHPALSRGRLLVRDHQKAVCLKVTE